MKQIATIIISLICVVAFAVFAYAESLAWNPNPAGDQVTNYKVYEHVGANYNLVATTGPSPSPTGSPVQYTFPLPFPTPAGTPRLFVLTAVNAGGESTRSTPDVAWTASPTPTPNPPTNLHLIP